MAGHPGVDPFRIAVPVAWSGAGEVTEFDTRIHYNVTAAFLDAHPDLAAFRVYPDPMLRVFAGDNPLAPAWTVALRFENEAAFEGSGLASHIG